MSNNTAHGQPVIQGWLIRFAGHEFDEASKDFVADDGTVFAIDIVRDKGDCLVGLKTPYSGRCHPLNARQFATLTTLVAEVNVVLRWLESKQKRSNP